MKKWILFSFSVFVGFQCFAQSKSLPNVIPVSPEAASLGKYGDIPIGYQTGIPSINIPIFQTTQGGIPININLSYHAGGIKVEEIASRVGLGWALNTGGTISRTLRGLEDESYDGYFKSFKKASKFFDGLMIDNNEKKDFLGSLYCNETDGEADIFNFSFGNFSGKFFFSSDSTFQTIPKSNLRIKFNWSNSHWELQGDDGNKYFFGLRERTFVEPYCYGNNNSQMESNNVWHLSKIVDPKGDSVIFKYVSEFTEMQMQGTDQYKTWAGGNLSSCSNTRLYCVNRVTTFSYQLSEIAGNSFKILFKNSPHTRNDLSGSKALQQISIINNLNDTIKKIVFYNSYFGSLYMSNQRLRLDSLEEISNNQKNSPYIFNYNEDVPIPDRLSFSQDYWGYYNGAVNNTLVQYQLTTSSPLVGANRRPNSFFSKFGIIKSLKYPTNGIVEFDFENNVYAKEITPGLDYDELTEFQKITGTNSAPSDNPAITVRTITITANDIIPTLGYAVFKLDLQQSCTDMTVFSNFSTSISSANGYTRNIVFNGDTLNLPMGTYTFTTSIETEFQNIPSCSFDLILYKVKYQTRNLKNILGGGLRIKEIRRYDAINVLPLIERFNYNLPNDTISSGYLSGELPLQMPYMHREGFGDPGNCDFLVFSATTTYPLLETSGKPIGYEYVKQSSFNALDFNGSKQMRFNTYRDNPDIVYSGYPYLPPEDRSWRRGLQIAENTFKKNILGNDELIQTVKKGYTSYGNFPTNPSVSSAKNVRISSPQSWVSNYFSDCRGEFNYVYGNALNYIISAYRTLTEPHSLKTDTIQQFDALQMFQKVTRYELNLNNYTISSDSTFNSKSDEMITYSKFPKDYQYNLQQNNFITSLINNNLVNAPIEVIRVIKKAGIAFVVSGEFISYNLQTLKPDSIFKLEIPNPIQLSTFQMSNLNSFGNFQKDLRYKLLHTIGMYDSKSNILEQQKANDIPECFIWGYGDQYPVAKIVGTTWAAANAVFTSADLAIINNPAATDVQMRNVLNNLRTSLPNTFVTTYTYKPLIGVTSETDPNGKTKYYEYDSFNRLKLIKDFNGNILKTFDYKYKQTY